MNKRKFGTLFTGGGGADIGMMDAGLVPVWGIELEADIASVANHNLGDHVTVANILDCDPADYELVDALHASPPCPNFSLAKAGGEESELDIGLAEKVAEFITHHRPQIFTLENVYAYRNSQSWLIIRDTLTGLGYNVAYWHLCAADYGGIELCPIHLVSNTRKHVYDAEVLLSRVSRMKTAPDIVRQSAMMPTDAQAKILAWDVAVELAQTILLDIAGRVTHRKLGKLPPKTNGAKTTQRGKVDELLMGAGIFESKERGNTLENTVSLLRRCLAESSEKERLFTTSMEIQRTTALKILKCLRTMPNTHLHTTGKTKSLKAGDQVINGDKCPLCKLKGVPQTRRRMIAVARRDGRPVRPEPTHQENPDWFSKKWVGWYEAIEDIIDTLPDSEFANWQKSQVGELKNQSLIGVGGYKGGITIAEDKTPSFVITKTTSSQVVRALLVPGGNSSSFSTRDAGEPSRTVGDTGRIGNLPRAFVVFSNVEKSRCVLRANIQGRVVKMTPRALARFQSFPDWYQLPDNNSLAIKIIGNAAPPLLMRRVYEANGGGADSGPPVGAED